MQNSTMSIGKIDEKLKHSAEFSLGKKLERHFFLMAGKWFVLGLRSIENDSSIIPTEP